MYLTVPATSTSAERVCSTAGLTVTRLRTSLTQEYVQKCLLYRGVATPSVKVGPDKLYFT